MVAAGARAGEDAAAAFGEASAGVVAGDACPPSGTAACGEAIDTTIDYRGTRPRKRCATGNRTGSVTGEGDKNRDRPADADATVNFSGVHTNSQRTGQANK